MRDDRDLAAKTIALEALQKVEERSDAAGVASMERGAGATERRCLKFFSFFLCGLLFYYYGFFLLKVEEDTLICYRLCNFFRKPVTNGSRLRSLLLLLDMRRRVLAQVQVSIRIVNC